MFEKYGICKAVGDVHGNPLSIVFKKNTLLWNDVLNKIGRRNQFIIAERKTGITVEALIKHVYEQELLGNVDKLPATQRILFLESFTNKLEEEKIDKIIEESKTVEEFKLAQLHDFKGLCLTQDSHKYIAQILNVPYIRK